MEKNRRNLKTSLPPAHLVEPGVVPHADPQIEREGRHLSLARWLLDCRACHYSLGDWFKPHGVSIDLALIIFVAEAEGRCESLASLGGALGLPPSTAQRHLACLIGDKAIIVHRDAMPSGDRFVELGPELRASVISWLDAIENRLVAAGWARNAGSAQAM